MPLLLLLFFFFNDTATTEIYTLSLHDALPICRRRRRTSPRARSSGGRARPCARRTCPPTPCSTPGAAGAARRWRRRCGGRCRSEEHTSELQSRQYLVCRLLLEKKKKNEIEYCI